MPEEKILILDKNVDAVNLLRRIGNQKHKKVAYRDRRPHLYAENVEYIPDNQGILHLKDNDVPYYEYVICRLFGDFKGYWLSTRNFIVCK